MKLAIILCLVLIFGACAQNISQNNQNSSTPFPKPTLSDLAKDEEAKRIERNKRELKEAMKKNSKQFGLSILEDQNLSNQDLQIRVWKFSAFGERHLVVILEKIKEKWSATQVEWIIVKKDIYKTNPPINLSRRNLGKPKVDWETLWQRLIEAEILTLPDGNEVGSEVCDDCWACVIETKVEGNYRVYDYFAPEEFSEIRESRQIVKIINLISDEFNVDLDSKTF